ncbi:MAG: PAS domain-containing protein, partial [Candidatus Thorarchaeota archaeon]
MGTPRKETEKGESHQSEENEFSFSEEMLKTLFTETPIGIVICDLQGNITRVNNAGVELLGSPSEEATKKINMLTFPPLRNIGVSDILIQCIDERRTIINELPYISKWEKTVIFRFKFVPVINKDGILTEVVCTFEDISPIRTSEKTRELYKGIVRNSIEAIAILDATGKYLEQNAAHEVLLGYSDKELEGKTPAIHLGEDVFASIYDELDKAGQSRKEVKSTTKDGSALDLDLVSFALKDEDGKPEFFIGIKRDITDRKLAEEYLRKSERRLAEAQSIAH